MDVARWLMFFWAALGSTAISHYGIRYLFFSTNNPVRQELLMGVGWGLFLGSFAYIALPILVMIDWKRITPGVRALQLLPAAIGFRTLVAFLFTDFVR